MYYRRISVISPLLRLSQIPMLLFDKHTFKTLCRFARISCWWAPGSNPFLLPSTVITSVCHIPGFFLKKWGLGNKLRSLGLHGFNNEQSLNKHQSMKIPIAYGIEYGTQPPSVPCPCILWYYSASWDLQLKFFNWTWNVTSHPFPICNTSPYFLTHSHFPLNLTSNFTHCRKHCLITPSSFWQQ